MKGVIGPVVCGVMLWFGWNISGVGSTAKRHDVVPAVVRPVLATDLNNAKPRPATTVSGKSPDHPESRQESTEFASEADEWKRADLLLGRRLIRHIAETNSQFQQEATARSQLAAEVQDLHDQNDALVKQISQLRRELQEKMRLKADRTDIKNLEASILAKQKAHDELLRTIETELDAALQELAETGERTAVLEHSFEERSSAGSGSGPEPVADVKLLSFRTREGEAELYERANSTLEVEIRGHRFPVMIRPAASLCVHVQLVKRQLSSQSHGLIDVGYVNHHHTDKRNERVHEQGYVAFVRQ